MYDVMNQQFLDAARAKALFAETGTSVAEWARVRGFSAVLVYQVLEGNRKCLRGQSHRIAIALGLKKGATVELSELSRLLETGVSTTISGATMK